MKKRKVNIQTMEQYSLPIRAMTIASGILFRVDFEVDC